MAQANKPAHSTEIIQTEQRGLTIGQLVESVTRITGFRCTSAMIYNYEKLGLLRQPSRTDGGFRLYNIDDVQLIVCIKRMQSRGKSLSEIKEELKNCDGEFQIEGDLLELPVDRRMQILEAAAIIFPQKGYAATTLQDIAQAAGISSSTIYQHFRSKEDLFIALTESLSFIDILDHINQSLDEKNDIDIEDVRKSLIKVGEGFLDTHMRNAEIVRMFIAESRDFPDVGRRYCQRLVSPVEKLLNKYLSAQMKRGLLREVNVELAVHAFYGIFLNFVVTQKLLVGEEILHFPKKNRVSSLVDIYLAGLHPSVSQQTLP